VTRPLVGLLVASALLLRGGCADAPVSTTSETSAQVVERLGAVPIPSAPAVAPAPAGAPGHPQLLAIGQAVDATLTTGRGRFTALGPNVTIPPGATLPLAQAAATLTLRASPSAGRVVLDAGDLTARNDHGIDIPLRAVGPGRVDVPAGRSGDLVVGATFPAGSAQVTWRTNGAVIAVWVFTVELD